MNDRFSDKKLPLESFLGYFNPAEGVLPKDFTLVDKLICKASHLGLSEPLRQIEGCKYGAVSCFFKAQKVLFRVAKTTPTKVGQFVTLWRRPSADAAIVPVDFEDGIFFVIVTVCDRNNKGLFIFDRQSLVDQGVFSKNGKGGKRAMRVYPPWVALISGQAAKSQEWQLTHYFHIVGPAGAFDVERLQYLLNFAI